MTQEIEGPAWIRAFLAALAETGVVEQAIAASGRSATAVYFQRRRNRRFAEAWAALVPGAAANGVPAAPGHAPVANNAGWKPAFLEALAETSNVTLAAERANVPTRTVYKRRRSDRAFAAKWLAALREGYDNLEMELLGYLRDPAPGRKMDVTATLRLLAAHRETVERQRALTEEDDEDGLLDSLDRFIDDMCVRREANAAIPIDGGLIEGAPIEGAPREAVSDNGAE